MVLVLCLLVFSAILFASIAITIKSNFHRRKLRHPPGPWNIPVFGYMIHFALNPLKKLEELTEKYGDVCSFFLGHYRVVMLNNYDVIRDAFKEDVFSGRPNLKMLETRNGGTHLGIVCNQGYHWLEQRKFTVRHLKEFGFGTQSMEGLLLEELMDLISHIRSESTLPVIDLQRKFDLAVLNSLWRITCGQRYKHSDLKLQRILKNTSADLAETQYTGPLLFLPWLLRVAPELTRWNAFKKSVKDVHEFLMEIIEDHKMSRQPFVIRDFIDAYLKEIDQTEANTSSFHKEHGERTLLVVLLDLFMAGGDTTSATLHWAFLYMVLHEDVQQRVRDEIDAVLGSNTPSLESRKRMPYTEATISEVLRKSSLVPMGLFHSAMHDTRFLGYDIEKGTVIAANLYHLNHDKKYWGDPENFRPERFLNSSGEILRNKRFLPFSSGKRVCPGEGLAKDQLFLFFVGLIQKFRFFPVNSKKLTEEPNHGVILTSKPYLVRVEEILPTNPNISMN